MDNWNKRKTPFIPNMNPPKTYECEVCGSKIVTRKENKYIVRDRAHEGGISTTLSGGYREPKEYDAFDCPVCGCQFIAKERLRNVEIKGGGDGVEEMGRERSEKGISKRLLKSKSKRNYET